MMLFKNTLKLWILALGFLPLFANQTTETPSKAVARIKHLTQDVVFVTLLEPEKVQVGTILLVTRDMKEVGKLTVQYVSSSSASCQAQTDISNLQIDDLAVIWQQPNLSEETPEELTDNVPIPVPQPTQTPSKPGFALQPKLKKERQTAGIIRGRLAVQWYQWIDSTYTDTSFVQPSLRFDIKGDALSSSDFQFRFKTRSRYTDRNRPFSSGISNSTQWQNKIYQASFGLADREKAFGFQAGRILNPVLSNIGPIDGGLFQWNPNSNNQFGAYAGFKPDWQYGDTNSEIKKYGIYFNHEKGSYHDFFWSTSLALNDEQFGSIVNRDYLYLSNQIQWGRKLSFYQSAEVDFMRDWRKEQGTSTFELTNLFTFLNYRFSDRFTAGVSYDTRKNTPTQEYLTTEEQFFDDLYRQGMRLNLYMRLWKQARLNMNYGVRSEQGEKDTTSYMMSFYQSQVWKRLSLSARYYGYENLYTKGQNPSLSLGWNFQKGHSINVNLNQTSYTTLANQTDLSYEWIGLQMYFYFTQKFYTTFQYEYNNSSNSSGQKIFLELGYRFR